jgi:hypothetical protein
MGDLKTTAQFVQLGAQSSRILALSLSDLVGYLTRRLRRGDLAPGGLHFLLRGLHLLIAVDVGLPRRFLRVRSPLIGRLNLAGRLGMRLGQLLLEVGSRPFQFGDRVLGGRVSLRALGSGVDG